MKLLRICIVIGNKNMKLSLSSAVEQICDNCLTELNGVFYHNKGSTLCVKCHSAQTAPKQIQTPKDPLSQIGHEIGNLAKANDLLLEIWKEIYWRNKETLTPELKDKIKNFYVWDAIYQKVRWGDFKKNNDTVCD